MKIEPEVDSGRSAFTSGGGGCATAQGGGASIGRPPGCGGCGPVQNGRCSDAFDCEHFQFIDEDDDEPAREDAMMSDSEVVAARTEDRPVRRQVSLDEQGTLRSVLKKASSARRQKGRVTFDEAVTLYSDESDVVQMLALTTGPDVNCAEVFYMFEPPIEYQDVPPFEPPAEYRDPDAAPEEVAPPEPEPEPAPAPVTITTAAAPAAVVVVATATTTTTNSGDVTADAPAGREDAKADATESETADETDKLFERFLEAEREFSVDEDLNSVFHALENDLAGDGKNGEVDDTFFRKLINLLSSVEAGEVPVQDGDPLSSSGLHGDDSGRDTEEDDLSQTQSRTLSEADSDCSISSQDTIIVRLGDEENDSSVATVTEIVPETLPEESPADVEATPNGVAAHNDDVFGETCAEPDKPRPLPRESLLKNSQTPPPAKTNGESLSRQSSGEQSVSGNSQDHPQDADDSTSSDSRSGEVEEEIRLDDIGYDEEDADDYDEESFRGMAHGNSKIRRIIKKNALQCTLFRGIEAKRRQQPGAKYPRPKSPLLSQESLVEKLKWLTTIDEQKDVDGPVNFHSKPPDVILSTGGMPVNGSVPSSEDEIPMSYPHPQYYPVRHMIPNSKGGYYVRPPPQHPAYPRMVYPPPQQQYPRPMVQHPVVRWPEQQPQPQHCASMTVPRNFRDWRVIQRVGPRPPQIHADYVRCSNGPVTATYPVAEAKLPKDELEQFVEQDSKRMERIKKRYSMAEEDEDPTFGFARRPSVRGIQNRIQSNPSDAGPPAKPYPVMEDPLGYPRQSPYPMDPSRHWMMRGQTPMHIHRASVALTELPGCATIPYTHRKPHPDPRYHSYAESMYGSTRTLPTKNWMPPPDPRACLNMAPNPAALQVPSKDERGVPEGASSSPKISSDSLYHAPVPDPLAASGSHKDDGVIYYSLNV